MNRARPVFGKGLRLKLAPHSDTIYGTGPVPWGVTYLMERSLVALVDEHLHFGSWNEVSVHLLREACNDPK